MVGHINHRERLITRQMPLPPPERLRACGEVIVEHVDFVIVERVKARPRRLRRC